MPFGRSNHVGVLPLAARLPVRAVAALDALGLDPVRVRVEVLERMEADAERRQDDERRVVGLLRRCPRRSATAARGSWRPSASVCVPRCRRSHSASMSAVLPVRFASCGSKCSRSAAAIRNRSQCSLWNEPPPMIVSGWYQEWWPENGFSFSFEYRSTKKLFDRHDLGRGPAEALFREGLLGHVVVRLGVERLRGGRRGQDERRDGGGAQRCERAACGRHEPIWPATRDCRNARVSRPLPEVLAPQLRRPRARRLAARSSRRSLLPAVWRTSSGSASALKRFDVRAGPQSSIAPSALTRTTPSSVRPTPRTVSERRPAPTRKRRSTLPCSTTMPYCVAPVALVQRIDSVAPRRVTVTRPGRRPW